METEHFFKIVSTLEKKGIYFTVVPHQWEENQILFWPSHLTHTNRELLRTNSASAPEANWDNFPCVLKMTKINSFKDGLDIEKKFTECVDTEAEEELLTNLTRKSKKAKTTLNSDLVDRNDLFSNMETRVQINNEVVENLPNITVNDTLGNDVLIFDGQVLNTEFNGVNNDELSHIRNEMTQIKNDVQSVKNEIYDLKKQIKEQFAKTNLVLDKILDTLEKNQGTNNNNIIENEKTENLLKKFIFPLKTCEEVMEFDKEIRKNIEFKSQLMTFLTNIGGRSGDSDGKKIAYKLFDTLFSPSVATKYSWTGVTRGKSGEEKKSFQVFQGIINVFFETLILADNRFTTTKNEQFFREGVLKHSKKRSLRIKKTNVNEEIEVTENDNTPNNDDADTSE